jgi:hypothetical protein
MWKVAAFVVFGVLGLVGTTWYCVNLELSQGAPTAPGCPPKDSSSPTETASEEPTTSQTIIADKESKVEDGKTPASPGPDTRPPKPASSSSAAAGTRFTRANFDKIKKGMPEEQVREILGSPTDTTYKMDTVKDQGRMVKSLQWTQTNPKATIEIEFIDGLARTKTTTLPPAPPRPRPQPDSTANDLLAGLPQYMRENHPKIKFGMTEDEVADLIGRGLGTSIETGTVNGSPYHIKTWSWKYYIPDQYYPYVTVIVKFTDGKVSGKNWIQVGPRKK